MTQVHTEQPDKKIADPERKALGQRLAAVRHIKGWKQEFVAEQMGMTKAALSAWETGRNLPDALALRRLAELYGIGADAILWENGLSKEALMVAAKFDSLNDRQRKTFETLVLAFVEEAVPDARVEAAFQHAQDSERKAGKRSSHGGPDIVVHAPGEPKGRVTIGELKMVKDHRPKPDAPPAKKTGKH